MHTCTTADLGNGFIAWAATTTAGIVCLVSPRARDDTKIKKAVRETLRRQGVDCGACKSCPAGITD